jgi:P-type Mg2+ transporter
MTMAPPNSPHWWLTPLAEPQAALATDASGLTGIEARSRLSRFGPNLFQDHRERSLVIQFLSRFRNPLVILLLAASAISAFTGEVTNFLIITVLVLFSVTLDFVQEHRAGKAAASLRQTVSVRAMAIRDGKQVEVPVAEVVPGDLVVLSAGDMIPADGCPQTSYAAPAIRVCLQRALPEPSCQRPAPPPGQTRWPSAGRGGGHAG